MPKLAKPKELDQGIVLGWSLGLDPQTRSRAYVARWVPLLPGVRNGSELPVFKTIYKARMRRSSSLGRMSLILAGPLGGLFGLLPEGRYLAVPVVVGCLAVGAAWWRRAPSMWERGPFVRLVGARGAAMPAEPMQLFDEDADDGGYQPEIEQPPTLLPASTIPSRQGFPRAAAPPPVVPPLAVPRSPVSRTPNWAAANRIPALKTPPWAPADPAPPADATVALPMPPKAESEGAAPEPVFEPTVALPMPSAFDTLVDGGDTRPPVGTAPGVEPDADFVVESGPDAGRTYRARDSSVKIGRAPDNDFVLGDPRTSRYHAQIERRVNEFWILDLGSANGTLLNGERVTECSLRHGDLIRIGQNKLTFQVVEPEPDPV